MEWTFILGLGLLAVCFSDARPKSYDYEYDVNTVPGIAGHDYPAIAELPPNDFYCEGKMAGYYADPHFGCQVYHKCDIDGRKDSFLCSNGTLFNQKTFVCEWWYSVDCSKTENYYHLNSELYKTQRPSYASPYYKEYSPHSHYAHMESYKPIPLHEVYKPKQKPEVDVPYHALYPSKEYKKPSYYSSHPSPKPYDDDDEDDEYEEYYPEPEPKHRPHSKPYHSKTPIKVYMAQPMSYDGKAMVEQVGETMIKAEH